MQHDQILAMEESILAKIEYLKKEMQDGKADYTREIELLYGKLDCIKCMKEDHRVKQKRVIPARSKLEEIELRKQFKFLLLKQMETRGYITEDGIKEIATMFAVSPVLVEDMLTSLRAKGNFIYPNPADGEGKVKPSPLVDDYLDSQRKFKI